MPRLEDTEGCFLTNMFPDRGKVGPTPAMTTRADEVFLSYIKDLRSVLMMGRSKDVHPKANAAIEAAGIKVEANHESVESVRNVIRHHVPEAGVWARVYRSTQEAFWQRVAASYGLREEMFIRMLDESDKCGPGSVTWDPNYVYPEYSKVETHRQPGGYSGDPLAGLVYDYGTRIFHGDASKDDFLHKALAEKVSLPLDGNVQSVMDIACSIGQLSCALKQRFPNAQVWGSDISSSMVRYAHYRAKEQNIDVKFLQKAAEDLDELPEHSYDLVTCHILFHEAPTPVVNRVIANVFRLLRPGGTFWVSDFPTLGNDTAGMLNYTNFLGAIDSADNSEPYAPEFVRSNVEAKLRRQGFSLRYEQPADIKIYGRVCDKPL
jgi:ubiquinone/menaquinone biosynthesis C-methylase UbiE